MHYSLLTMTKEEFILAELKNRNIPRYTKTGKDILLTISIGYRESGWSAAGHTKMSKKYFPDKPYGDTIFNFLLYQSKKGYCTYCDTVKDNSEFQSRSDNNSKTKSTCRSCQYSYKLETQGHSYFANSSAKYRAAKVSAVPSWANLDKISEIYENCPEGYHVDHIFPLQGETCCGLHVENNLQYLPAKDNLSKSNKVPVNASVAE